MNNARNLARCAAAGVGALVLVGGGIAVASTVPSEPPGDTTAASAAPTDTATMESMSMDTAAAGSEPISAVADRATARPSLPPSKHRPRRPPRGPPPQRRWPPRPGRRWPLPPRRPPRRPARAETTGGSMAPTESMAAASGPFVQVAESDEYGPIRSTASVVRCTRHAERRRRVVDCKALRGRLAAVCPSPTSGPAARRRGSTPASSRRGASGSSMLK